MGCSQNHGPLLGIDYITAPNIQGYQNGTRILGTPRMAAVHLSQSGPRTYDPKSKLLKGGCIWDYIGDYYRGY